MMIYNCLLLQENTDVTFRLECNRSDVLVNLSIYSCTHLLYLVLLVEYLCIFYNYAFIVMLPGGHEQELGVAMPCSKSGGRIDSRVFSHEQYAFGQHTNTTFYVHVYAFETPVQIKVSYVNVD